MQVLCLTLVFVTVFLIPYRALADSNDDVHEDSISGLSATSGQDRELHSNQKLKDIAGQQPESRQRRNINNTMHTITNATTATDDECRFVESFNAKSERRQLILPVDLKQYSRNDCIYWEIETSSSEVVEVQIPVIHSCKDGSLKLFDEDYELTSNYRKWSEASKFITKGSDLAVYFKPGYCTANVTLSYRSLPKPPKTDKRVHDSDENDDNDEDDNRREDHRNSTGSIVGAVIGSVLAVLLVVVVLFFVRKWMKRRRERNSASRNDSVALHLWSKPGGLSMATNEKPSSSRGDQYSSGPQSAAPAKRPLPADPGLTSNNGTVPLTYVTIPVPPPYNGSPAPEAFHHSEDLPPSYIDVINNRR